MEEFPSGQREQTVNLSSVTSVVRIHPPPPLLVNPQSIDWGFIVIEAFVYECNLFNFELS